MMAHKLIYSSNKMLNFYKVVEKFPATMSCIRVLDKGEALITCSTTFPISPGKYLIAAVGAGGRGAWGGDRGWGGCMGGGAGGSAVPVETIINIGGAPQLRVTLGIGQQYYKYTYVDLVRKSGTTRLISAPPGEESPVAYQHALDPTGRGGGGDGGHWNFGGRKGSCTDWGRPGTAFILSGGAGGNASWDHGGGGGGAGSRFPYCRSIAASMCPSRTGWCGGSGVGFGAGGGGGNGCHDYNGGAAGQDGNPGAVYILKV